MMLAILLLGLMWSVGVSNLIPCKTLLNISVKCSSFLPHVTLSVLYNKRESKALCTETDSQANLQAGTDSYLYNRQRGLKEDTGRAKRIEILVPLDSERKCFDLLP